MTKKPKPAKPKREWMMYAVIGNVNGMNGSYFETKTTAEYAKEASPISRFLKIKKVLVREL